MFLMPGERATGGRASRRRGFPGGTTMLFIQPSAPVGWTRVTANDDALLRIVGATTPGTGGSNGFVSTFNSQTVVGNTTLSTAQIPSHTHSYTGVAQHISGACAGGQGPCANTTGSAGGGGAHNHSVTTSIKYVDSLVAKKN